MCAVVCDVKTFKSNGLFTSAKQILKIIEGVMSRSRVDALLELCSPLLQGGNSAFNAAIASDPFPKIEYRSLE